MATFNKCESFVGGLGLGHLNLNTDTLKAALTNTAPTATGTNGFADITEIATGNGYVGGGSDITNTYSETGGVGTVAATDVTWTATGGSIGPFQYVFIYDDTVTTAGFVDQAVGWYAATGAITLSAGESFTLDFGASFLTIT